MVGGREGAQCKGGGRSGPPGWEVGAVLLCGCQCVPSCIHCFPTIASTSLLPTVWILYYLLSIRSQEVEEILQVSGPSCFPHLSPHLSLEITAAVWRGEGSLELEDGGVEKGTWGSIEAKWQVTFLFLISLCQPWISGTVRVNLCH